MNLQIELPKDLETPTNIEAMIQTARALPVHDGNYEHIAQGARQVRARISEIEAQRDAIVKPINAGLKNLRDFFRPALDGYTSLRSVLDGKLLEHQRALLARRAEAVAAAPAAPVAALQTLAALAAVPPPAGVSVRETWACEVVNPLAVPREFLVVDEKALLDYARRTDPSLSPQVPGVRFFKVQGIAVRK